jgi:trk system potassium uptake protein TrkA
MSRLRKLTDWAGVASSPQAGATGDIAPAQSVFIAGLGRFGTAMALELIDLRIEVLAIDTDQELVDYWANKLSHVRRANGTDIDTLRQLGVSNFDTAVVAIGSDIEASILTTAALADLNGPAIWAKALTRNTAGF